MPDQPIVDHLVFMAIDVACPGHRWPIDCGMIRLEIIRQAARRFRNDLEGARHGIDRLPVAHEGFPMSSRP